MYAIVNNSLVNSQIYAFLSKVYKLRTSPTTIKNSIIFPASGVIFFIFREINREDAFKEISKMSQTHRNCFVLCFADAHSFALDFELFFQMQTKFLDSNLCVIPARNDLEACDCMDVVARAHHKDGSTTILDRLKPEAEPCWSDEDRLDLLKNLGFSEHESFMLLDNLGSVEGMTCATHQELLDCLNCRAIADKADRLFAENNSV